jgi:hypothetical protein
MKKENVEIQVKKATILYNIIAFASIVLYVLNVLRIITICKSLIFQSANPITNVGVKVVDGVRDVIYMLALNIFSLFSLSNYGKGSVPNAQIALHCNTSSENSFCIIPLLTSDNIYLYIAVRYSSVSKIRKP